MMHRLPEIKAWLALGIRLINSTLHGSYFHYFFVYPLRTY